VCAAAVDAITRQLAGRSPTDPAFAAIAARLHGPGEPLGPAGADAVLDLVPELVKSSDPAVAAICRELVRAGLAAPAVDTKVRAIRLALQPGVTLAADVVTLLNDADAGVRSAALLAVGPPGDGGPVIGDEELFRWLNDPDRGVRKLCESVLVARGRSADEIAFGRKLTHPEASERLALLLDLRWADDAVKDVGPWLERLSRDPDPAVRAGAARVAAECRVMFAGWLDKLATDDPDATVRQVAAFYRGQAAGGVNTAGYEER
jgi:HEAT repeat protein